MTKNIMLLFIIIIVIPLVAIAQRQKPEEIEIDGHPMYTLMDPGEIPAIFDPQFLNTGEADSFYYASEPLIVVSSGSEVKAYSTWHLDRHEVVNDYIDGKAITVTW